MKRKRGFTLLEILVVLVVLLTGLSVLTSLLGSAMRQSVEAEEKTSIQLYCQNRLNRILSGEEPVLSGESEPIAGFEDWQMTVHADSAPLPELVRIRVSAQKYEKIRNQSPDRPGIFIDSDVPVMGQHLVIAQWVRREMVRLKQPVSSGTIGSLAAPEANSIPDSFSAPGPDPFAAGGFAPERVIVPESLPQTRNASSDGESTVIGGDAASHSLLERVQKRRRGAE